MMRQFSATGQQAINDIAQRHGFSFDAVASMLEALIAGNGSMAQFNHAEFAGYGQWMRGGMTMVSDMFNNHLKNRVDSLCSELAQLLANQPELLRQGSFQSQSQGDGQQQQNGPYRAAEPMQGNAAGASLFVPGASSDWWPSDLRWPDSTGAQNGVRYAYFSGAARLAIEVNGHVTVYNTLDHRIGGFSQQQGYNGSLSFTSQYGLIDVASLPVVSGGVAVQNTQDWAPPVAPAQAAAPAGGRANEQDVFATLQKLAELRASGILTDEEFAAKKVELLNRI